MLKQNNNQKGETIVEVLLSLAILSLVLGVSYALASKSLKASQSAQERTEASQAAQSLIEVIRVYAERDNSSVFPLATSDLCFETDLLSITNEDPPVNYDPVSPDPICIEGRYRKHVIITPLVVPVGQLPQYEFTSTVEWESLSGGSDQVIMRYKFVRVPSTP